MFKNAITCQMGVSKQGAGGEIGISSSPTWRNPTLSAFTGCHLWNDTSRVSRVRVGLISLCQSFKGEHSGTEMTQTSPSAGKAVVASEMLTSLGIAMKCKLP